jgi:hypothetical protein
VDDSDVMSRIKALMDEEQALRLRHADGHPVESAEAERLRVLEEQLDQCWDLLRQRRAREEFGMNPDEAEPRATDTVERYIQ